MVEYARIYSLSSRGERPSPGATLQQSTRSRRGEGWLQALFFSCAAASLLITVVGLSVLIVETIGFGRQVGWSLLVASDGWDPSGTVARFSIIPLIYGSVMIAVPAVTLALVMAVAIALHSEEFARPGARRRLDTVLAVLDSVPAVVWAWIVITGLAPLLASWLSPDTRLPARLLAIAGLAAMLLPEATRQLRAGLSTVAQPLREAAYALGAREAQVIARVVLPQLRGWLPAATASSLARALGEATLVTLVAGGLAGLPGEAPAPVAALTDAFVRVGLQDAPQGSPRDEVLFALALVLACATLVLHTLARRMLARRHHVVPA